MRKCPSLGSELGHLRRGNGGRAAERPRKPHGQSAPRRNRRRACALRLVGAFLGRGCFSFLWFALFHRCAPDALRRGFRARAHRRNAPPARSLCGLGLIGQAAGLGAPRAVARREPGVPNLLSIRRVEFMGRSGLDRGGSGNSASRARHGKSGAAGFASRLSASTSDSRKTRAPTRRSRRRKIRKK